MQTRDGRAQRSHRTRERTAIASHTKERGASLVRLKLVELEVVVSDEQTSISGSPQLKARELMILEAFLPAAASLDDRMVRLITYTC
jgi:hypothetical protein